MTVMANLAMVTRMSAKTATKVSFSRIVDKKLSYCRESAHLTSLYRTMQKAFWCWTV